MFIELTEFLRCPKDHEETHAVCLPLEMEGRDVVRGVVGCPVCRAEYAIVGGVADFTAGTGAQAHGGTGEAEPGEGGRPRSAEASTSGAQPGVPGALPERKGSAAASASGPLTAEVLATLLDLRGPGGFLLLAGAAARLGGGLAPLVPDVHIVCLNAPASAPPAPGCSFLLTSGRFPLTTSSLRAVVLGADAAVAPWLAEGARVLLRGLRYVVEDERASPAGVAELARGAGLFVGEKRDR